MTKRRGPSLLLRVLVIWAVTAAALYGWSLVIPGVTLNGARTALAAAGLFGLFNALVWPLLVRLLLPITVLTVGLGAFILNGLVVLAVAIILPGLTVASLWSAIALAFGLTLANVIVTTLLAIDDDDFYYRNVVSRAAKRQTASHSTIPGVVFVQIDGLSHEVLLRAIRNGDAPTLASWLRGGTHRLFSWETDWSSQTGASQAGLLLGSNDDMPGFRWWEKERNQAMVSNHPRDAMEIERRHSSGRGLLAFDGASRGNVVSGDAPRSSLTMSTVLTRHREGRIGHAYYSYFANPYNLTRTLLLTVTEVIRERRSAASERRRDVQPRIDRNFTYALLRAWTCVVQRDLQIAAVIGDMFDDCPTVYCDILGYDEVAHHSGVERADSLRVLRDIDWQLARLQRAARQAPRPYQVVVLSDHGQSQGPTFSQRFGHSLERVVSEASAGAAIESTSQGDESRGYLAGSLDEASIGDGILARVFRRLRPGDTSGEPRPVPELVVMASGNLGLIYFPRRPGRLTLQQIETAYPKLLPALRNHPGVGFLLVRSSAGPVVIGRQGKHYLDTDRIEGADPLAAFGPHAAQHVRRTDGFAHTADIMVNGSIDQDTGDVFAFEELVGSHGGLGGAQSFPFLLTPATWSTPAGALRGAEAVYEQMCQWLANLGHAEFREQSVTSTATYIDIGMGRRRAEPAPRLDPDGPLQTQT